MNTMLRQRRLRWLGHVCRMEDGRLPKEVLYGELKKGTRAAGRPNLRFKDVCKRDMKALDFDLGTWEDLTSDRDAWRSTLSSHLLVGEEKILDSWKERRERRKNAPVGNVKASTSSNLICANRACKCYVTWSARHGNWLPTT